MCFADINSIAVVTLEVNFFIEPFFLLFPLFFSFSVNKLTSEHVKSDARSQ